MNGFRLTALRRTVNHRASDVSSARKKKGKKKQGKQCDLRETERCTADVAICQQVLLAECGDNAQCVADNTPCCATCSADGFLTCLLNNANASTAAIARFG